MKVPNANQAVVEHKKVVDYLLNLIHPDGAPKARFFLSMGFAPDEWQILADNLREMILENDITERIESLHGLKFIVDGPIRTPVGQWPRVRTVWIIDEGASAPRLVTAYPAPS
jgi:hypothetical protein